MATLPHFRHIHCSSRFDRSAASLDADITNWQQECSLITLTEVESDNRAAQLKAQGWGYYYVRNGNFAEDCAVGWDASIWKRVSGSARKLTTTKYIRGLSQKPADIYTITVVLKHISSGHKLLVGVTHMPAHIEGKDGWRTDLAHWQGRKAAYMAALDNWSTHVKDQVRKQHCDGVLVVADWNLNFKAQWFRDLLKQKWGKEYIIAWKDMPTSGGSLHGGPVAPLGAPGKGSHDRIIDGSLYHGLKITDPPNLLARVSSSDHRPYHESFSFLTKGQAPDSDNTGQGTGDTHKTYPEWWGFGDYMDDELYEVTRVTGEAGGEVL